MMDIGNAVSTMVSNMAAQTDPAYAVNRDVMAAVAGKLRSSVTTEQDSSLGRLDDRLLSHVEKCKRCKAKGDLDKDCRIGELVFRASAKVYGIEMK